jgi:hypothetical protein
MWKRSFASPEPVPFPFPFLLVGGGVLGAIG